MKASDTVMPFSQIEAIDLKNAESNFTDALYDVAREQAEISFKSGIKEVVEFINKEMLPYHGLDEYITVGWDEKWQSKLKEWGIDG